MADISSRLVEAYRTIQALGGKVKPSPHAYSDRSVRGLETRAERLQIAAENKLVESPSPAAAFRVLLARGERVKSRLADYKNPTTLVRRASELVVSQTPQGVILAATPSTERRFVDLRGGGRREYVTYTVPTGPATTGGDGLKVAREIIARHGPNYDRAFITQTGIARPGLSKRRRRGGGKYASISGQQASPPRLALQTYTEASRFERVNDVSVTFSRDISQ